MPAIAPPPPSSALPRVAAPPAPSAAIERGRTLADYVQCFELDLPALRGRDVLDVGAGVSSFVAEACARRIDAVGVDPMYGMAPDALALRIASEPAPGAVSQFARPAAAASDDPAGAGTHRFLSDYETHFLHGRYVSGALPRLPFFDGTFDLVLCAHVLFAGAAAFDLDWHLAAARELVRVSAGEVRISPLCGANGRPHPKLAAFRRELNASGITSETRTLSAAMPAGARTFLSLRRADS